MLPRNPVSKRILFISKFALISAVFALQACATVDAPTAQAIFGEPTPFVKNIDQSPAFVGEKAGVVRQPSQVGSTAWIEDSRTFTVQPSGGNTNFVLSPRQTLTTAALERYTCELPGWGETTCEDYVCSGGVGKSDLWNEYYSTPGPKKIAALDAALQGIGPVGASKLQAAGLFQKKPVSWQEFRQRMNDALRRKVITERMYKDVFNTYGAENRFNLGYTGDRCSSQTYRCEVYGLFPVIDGCTKTVNAEQTINVFNKPITVTVRNPQLQPFETEEVTVVAGPEYESIRVLRSDKTEYRVSKQPSGNGAAILLEGVGRYQSALPANSIRSLTFADGRGRNMQAIGNVDPRAIGLGDDKLMLTLSVTHCPTAPWYAKFGECKGRDSVAKVALAPSYTRVTQAQQAIDLPTIPAGHRVWVTATLHRENSRYYTNTPIGGGERKLPEVKK